MNAAAAKIGKQLIRWSPTLFNEGCCDCRSGSHDRESRTMVSRPVFTPPFPHEILIFLGTTLLATTFPVSPVLIASITTPPARSAACRGHAALHTQVSLTLSLLSSIYQPPAMASTLLPSISLSLIYGQSTPRRSDLRCSSLQHRRLLGSFLNPHATVCTV